MIVRGDKLVMCVTQPQVVLDTLKCGFKTSVEGRQLVVVPHTYENTTKLRALGLEPPSVPLFAKWPGRFHPFKHQEKCAEFLVNTKRGFNLSDPGTGKTAAALWAYEYLARVRGIGRVLIASPLSVLSVWEDEAFSVLPHRSFCKLVGTKEKRKELLGMGSEICVINHDGIGTILEELKKVRFDVVILDEASAYKNAQTKRYKQFRELVEKVPYVWLLTGTPVSKAPTDAYALIKLVDKQRFAGGFTLFRELTMTKVSMFKWVPKVDSKEFVYKHLQPAIRFKKEDCIDLPPVTYVTRTAALTGEQSKAYHLMKKKMVMERREGEKITAANAAVKLLKLVQIACGVVKDNDGQHYKLEATDRLKALEEIVEEVGGKVIVFVPFVGVMHVVRDFLVSKGYTAEIVNGEVSEKERSRIFSDFQRGGLDCLVAHPRTASHGLNLTASSSIIWYGPIWSTEGYTQANARIHRQGQKLKTTIYHIISTTLEAGIFKALWGEIQMSNAILELYEGMT
jgi:SNF2 family DNA or RNA helicase